ncbi:phytoene/squalene synthase family protein [Arthrobacter sp. H20]|uniref:phytoene/squalene synthase family protein n=1 Tax=Arthrobacter sp. H20 TaxID=1267981 RepID=UPI00047D6B09|nr:phytoene/squalene synthase family protein [Arthrobacter sp. H20]
MQPQQALAFYTGVTHQASALIIRSYSTSFGLASRLLGADVRQHVETVYALVRVADEVVDGAAAAAGLSADQTRSLLDELESETERALATGYSANPVVHAFAATARQTGITDELTRPFFASMRADLDQTEHTQESFDNYVYGSAEVVGLMCLKCFLYQEASAPTSEQERKFIDGARRLGAAFQKINFLRDLAEDFESLGRSYFPGIRPGNFDEADKHRLLDDIAEDLAVSAGALRDLPSSSRRAVAVAQGLFTELAARLRHTPAEDLLTSRVRVPNPVKLRIAARALAGRLPQPHETPQ